MRPFYLIARFFPYWALPVTVICCEVAWHFKRKKNSIQYYFWVSAVFLALSTLMWFGFRGDLHSDEWVLYFSGG
jgi:hypothetical protein